MIEKENIIYDPLRDAGEKLERIIQDVGRALFAHEQELESIKQKIVRLKEHGIGSLREQKLQEAQRES